jgi:hypothetical protein
LTPAYNNATGAWYDAEPCKRYTAYTDRGDIDVDAPDKRHAMMIAVWVLRETCEPGGKIDRIEERHGLYT